MQLVYEFVGKLPHFSLVYHLLLRRGRFNLFDPVNHLWRGDLDRRYNFLLEMLCHHPFELIYALLLFFLLLNNFCSLFALENI